MLVGVYGDGSNATSLLESPLLERDLNLDEPYGVMGQMLAAKEAAENSYGNYASYLIMVTPKS